jgi:FkbM family methyltransferase
MSWKSQFVCLNDGIELSVDLREGIAQNMRERGSYDPAETVLVKRLLSRSGVFFDVGANVGYYTCIAAKLVGETGHVHAFEANPMTAQHLTRSVEINGLAGVVDVNVAAVTDTVTAKTTFYVDHDAPASPLASLLPDHNWGSFSSSIQVPGMSLDAYVAARAIAAIDVVKMDIEGAEMLALRGFAKTLAESPPRAVILELVDDGIASPAQIIEYMERFDFSGYAIHTPLVLEKLSRDSDPGHVNALFINESTYNQTLTDITSR